MEGFVTAIAARIPQGSDHNLWTPLIQGQRQSSFILVFAESAAFHEMLRTVSASQRRCDMAMQKETVREVRNDPLSGCAFSDTEFV
jgi:hypothetical protein